MRELGGLPGVEKVTADHKTQVVRLALDVEKMSPDEAREQLERAGFPAARPCPDALGATEELRGKWP